ncbi:hypothetical protein J437_LFUL019035 [Ladona fulva]|uniref:RNA-directed DNA polymerase n=1 Tax=Ladona fulva TaxID=123851 RepID=A0A8K0KRR6_LADFU|nr:hypothetical protein J437_LFUL019035 [Ladona fulva]
MVIPMAQLMLAALHKDHPGIVATMQSLARFYTMWPKMDQDINDWVKGCQACQENHGQESDVPLYSWNIPEWPLEQVMWILQVHSKRNNGSFWWMHIPNGLKYGVPQQLVSDTGTSFISEEFCKFCKFNGVKHISTLPYHPKTNGLAEWLVQTFKRFLASQGDAGDHDFQLQWFLLSHCNTPHATTGKAPTKLFLGHHCTTCFDRLKPDPRNKVEIKVWKQKVYHDANVRACSFRQGDEASVENECKPGWCPGVVGRKTGKQSGPTDDTPTSTVVNQQQEFEVQESRLPEQQLRAQDSSKLEVDTQSLKKQQCKEGLPDDSTEATSNTSKNVQKSQRTRQSSRNQCYEGQSDHPLAMDLTNNF